MKNLLVIGSINMDSVIHTPRLPKPGEVVTVSRAGAGALIPTADEVRAFLQERTTES